MNIAELRSKRDVANDRDTVRSAGPPDGGAARRGLPVIPVLVTLATVVLAAPLCWAMWNAYMGVPWTRDSTVRTYVVTEAPEVAGRVVELPVADNQFVHKGDLLLVIDPTDFRIALEQAEATVRQAQANVQNFEAQITAQQAQVMASEAQTEQAQAALTFAQQQAARYRYLAGTTAGTVMMEQQTASTLLQDQAALKSAQAAVMVAQRQIETLKAQLMSAHASVAQATAQRGQARVNLERTQIRSPVNGWITNLLVRVGDYAARRAKRDLDGRCRFLLGGRLFRRDATHLGPRRRSRRDQIDGLTWVRLAQRVPVRIQIDQVPEGVRLVAGMTATVQIDPQPKAG
jgi:multidrug resistance efflux pump